MNNNRDFDIEKQRYDLIAKKILRGELILENLAPDWGAQNLLFSDSEKAASSIFNSNDEILELGAGTGDHTAKLIKLTNKKVRTLDISEFSLKVLDRRFPGRTIPVIASMDQIPLETDSIDGIASFGSLAYANPEATDSFKKRRKCHIGRYFK